MSIRREEHAPISFPVQKEILEFAKHTNIKNAYSKQLKYTDIV